LVEDASFVFDITVAIVVVEFQDMEQDVRPNNKQCLTFSAPVIVEGFACKRKRLVVGIHFNGTLVRNSNCDINVTPIFIQNQVVMFSFYRPVTTCLESSVAI
jgi:hypothetical protein